ncbi:MAG: phage major capsid protein, partial [Anaerolineales bacterium]|nr:phage major capsid protein [Anaerolineales bacterium]
QEVPTSANGTVRYVDWDEATKVRAAAMIAEGATFPESTAAWQTYTVKLKKVADILPWTDEFEYDDAFLVGELQRFLVININLIKGTQIINGDGTGNNLEGIFNVSPAYTPVAAGITDASIYDLIVKLREAIETGQRNGVQVDFALMNITDINKYKLKKDGENNYIMPPFYDADGNRIDGVTIIEDNAVPANTMVIGDSRYTMIYREPGLNVEIGYSGTDFEEGKKRMRVYERCLFLIRTVDRTAFLEVTDIDAALTTLAS